MRIIRRQAFAILSLLTLGAAAQAQEQVKMFAATALVAGKPQVRLRWQFESGWVPDSGLKVFRVAGTNRDLLKALPAPDDSAVDALFPPQFRGRKLWTAAQRPLPETIKLDFGIIRPPSSLPVFDQRKSFFDTIRVNPGPLTPEQRRRIPSLFALPGMPKQPSTKPAGATASATSLTQKPSDVDITKSARSELQLIALVRSSLADNLALGATDTDVRAGQKVSYQLVARGSNGDRVLASVNDFVVGSDPQPPAPTGLRFLQDEDSIGLRWDRLAPADEQRLLQASYEISRSDSAAGQPKDITPKPVVILTLDGNREPVSFFTDKVPAPGQVIYRISLVDGFGRVSEPASLNVPVAEFRSPAGPSESAVSLGVAFKNAIRLSSPKIGQPVGIQAVPQATVIWRPRTQAFDIPARFNIYRLDLDNPASPPAKLTSSPIDGTPMPADTDAQVEEVASLLYADRVQRLDDAIEAAQAKPAGPNRDKLVAIASAKKKAFFASLASSLKARPALKFIDTSASKDKRFAYSVTTVFTSIGTESQDVQAGVLSIPDSAAPPAISGITQKFTAAAAFKRVFETAPVRSKTKQFAAPNIRDRLLNRRKAPGVRSPGIDDRLPIKLTLVPNDSGGTVQLSWNPVPNLKDVRYQVRRTFGSQTVEVGVTAPNKPTINDTVPRTRERTYRYEVTAISRWNVSGAPATADVTVPATVPPDTPNVLSARPGGEGQIKIAIEPHAKDQGVARYVVLRDGQQAGTLQWAANGPLEFTDSGLAPNAPHSYVVRAETGGNVKSPDSAAVKCSALKLSASPPTGVQAVFDAQKGVRITWQAPAGATSYIVKRKQGNGPLIVLAGKVTDATFTDVMAMAGQSYTYQVFAVDSAGNVSAAATASVAVP